MTIPFFLVIGSEKSGDLALLGGIYMIYSPLPYIHRMGSTDPFNILAIHLYIMYMAFSICLVTLHFRELTKTITMITSPEEGQGWNG